MALINHVTKEINAKIVYYGPEGGGKTSSLRYVFDRIRPSLRGELRVVPASGSALLVFNFSPFEQPFFEGYRIRFHMYTLQGRVANLAAWKMILKGADGLVIVTRASQEGLLAGQQSLVQLREILGSYGVCLDDIPVVLQLDESVLSSQIDVEAATRKLGLSGCYACLTSAQDGKGVLEVLTALSRSVMERIAERDDLPRERMKAADAVATETAPVDTPATEVVTGSTSKNAWNESYKPQRLQAISTIVPDSINAEQVAVVHEDVRVEGGKVVIPLEVSTCDGGQQRLIVTVVVAPG